MCACYKRRAKVGPLPLRSVKSRDCRVSVGRAGGVCDGIGTARVTVCTGCGAVCDQAVLRALQYSPGWRMLGHTLSVAAAEGCVRVRSTRLGLALKYRIRFYDCSAAERSLRQLLHGANQTRQGEEQENARQSFKSPCPASLDRHSGKVPSARSW